ncbi:MAG: hypothetical protein ACW99F_03790 [Candidatus Hodarchaeales archaeon]|jgi:hypothetical protein
MPNCDACYGQRTNDCPEDCLTSHVRYEGCTTCGNQDVFYELIDGNFICGVCASLLKKNLQFNENEEKHRGMEETTN